MSTHKNIDLTCLLAGILAIALAVFCLFGTSSGLIVTTNAMGYENRLFDTERVHAIDIVMDNWDSFLRTCQSEEYTACTVVIDGEKYGNIGIRGKGNTSLSNVASMGSNRYSFKLEFDRYENGKTYHGLDKLCLNNIVQDNTYMKDYLTYRMMVEFGVDAPLCSYVYITVNGEDWGLYLAVEGVEESFLQRSYGNDYGELYKPDSTSFGGGRGNGKDFSMDDFGFKNSEGGEMPEPPSGDFDFSQMPQMGNNVPNRNSRKTSANEKAEKPDSDQADFRPGGGEIHGMPRGGQMSDMAIRRIPNIPGSGNTNYNAGTDASHKGDEEITVSGSGEQPTVPENSEGAVMTDRDSRPNMGGMGNMGGPGGMGSADVMLQYIDNSPESYSNIFNNAKTDITDADKDRLIASLKKLSSCEDLENVLDVEMVLRYFVVHNFTVNGDSYTGSMIHNYYLYEEDGKMSMIPWDYNLAYGTFQGADALFSVNDAIDEALDDRPMQAWIFSNETYTQQYHELYEEFLTTVDVQGIIEDAYTLIAPYVAKDPTAFCTYEEFETGLETLKAFCKLRTSSVFGQLNGSIPSTDDAQSADSNTLIDAGDLNLSDMGTMSLDDKGGFREDNMQNGIQENRRDHKNLMLSYNVG